MPSRDVRERLRAQRDTRDWWDRYRRMLRGVERADTAARSAASAAASLAAAQSSAASAQAGAAAVASAAASAAAAAGAGAAVVGTTTAPAAAAVAVAGAGAPGPAVAPGTSPGRRTSPLSSGGAGARRSALKAARLQRSSLDLNATAGAAAAGASSASSEQQPQQPPQPTRRWADLPPALERIKQLLLADEKARDERRAARHAARAHARALAALVGGGGGGGGGKKGSGANGSDSDSDNSEGSERAPLRRRPGTAAREHVDPSGRPLTRSEVDELADLGVVALDVPAAERGLWPYHRQGDATLYARWFLQRRSAVRAHPQFTARVLQWFTTPYPATVTAGGLAASTAPSWSAAASSPLQRARSTSSSSSGRGAGPSDRYAANRSPTRAAGASLASPGGLKRSDRGHGAPEHRTRAEYLHLLLLLYHALLGQPQTNAQIAALNRESVAAPTPAPVPGAAAAAGEDGATAATTAATAPKPPLTSRRSKAAAAANPALARAMAEAGTADHCLAVIRADWNTDAARGVLVSIARFHDALFQVIDNWCVTAELPEYLQLCDQLYGYMTVPLGSRGAAADAADGDHRQSAFVFAPSPDARRSPSRRPGAGGGDYDSDDASVDDDGLQELPPDDGDDASTASALQSPKNGTAKPFAPPLQTQPPPSDHDSGGLDPATAERVRQIMAERAAALAAGTLNPDQLAADAFARIHSVPSPTAAALAAAAAAAAADDDRLREMARRDGGVDADGTGTAAQALAFADAVLSPRRVQRVLAHATTAPGAGAVGSHVRAPSALAAATAAVNATLSAENAPPLQPHPQPPSSPAGTTLMSDRELIRLMVRATAEAADAQRREDAAVAAGVDDPLSPAAGGGDGDSPGPLLELGAAEPSAAEKTATRWRRLKARLYAVQAPDQRAADARRVQTSAERDVDTRMRDVWRRVTGKWKQQGDAADTPGGDGDGAAPGRAWPSMRQLSPLRRRTLTAATGAGGVAAGNRADTTGDDASTLDRPANTTRARSRPGSGAATAAPRTPRSNRLTGGAAGAVLVSPRRASSSKTTQRRGTRDEYFRREWKPTPFVKNLADGDGDGDDDDHHPHDHHGRGAHSGTASAGTRTPGDTTTDRSSLDLPPWRPPHARKTPAPRHDYLAAVGDDEHGGGGGSGRSSSLAMATMRDGARPDSAFATPWRPVGASRALSSSLQLLSGSSNDPADAADSNNHPTGRDETDDRPVHDTSDVRRDPHDTRPPWRPSSRLPGHLFADHHHHHHHAAEDGEGEDEDGDSSSSSSEEDDTRFAARQPQISDERRRKHKKKHKKKKKSRELTGKELRDLLFHWPEPAAESGDVVLARWNALLKHRANNSGWARMLLPPRLYGFAKLTHTRLLASAHGAVVYRNAIDSHPPHLFAPPDTTDAAAAGTDATGQQQQPVYASKFAMASATANARRLHTGAGDTTAAAAAAADGVVVAPTVAHAQQQLLSQARARQAQPLTRVAMLPAGQGRVGGGDVQWAHGVVPPPLQAMTSPHALPNAAATLVASPRAVRALRSRRRAATPGAAGAGAGGVAAVGRGPASADVTTTTTRRPGTAPLVAASVLLRPDSRLPGVSFGPHRPAQWRAAVAVPPTGVVSDRADAAAGAWGGATGHRLPLPLPRDDTAYGADVKWAEPADDEVDVDHGADAGTDAAHSIAGAAAAAAAAVAGDADVKAPSPPPLPDAAPLVDAASAEAVKAAASTAAATVPQPHHHQGQQPLFAEDLPRRSVSYPLRPTLKTLTTAPILVAASSSGTTASSDDATASAATVVRPVFVPPGRAPIPSRVSATAVPVVPVRGKPGPRFGTPVPPSQPRASQQRTLAATESGESVSRVLAVSTVAPVARPPSRPAAVGAAVAAAWHRKPVVVAST